jgi:glycosyltransferase involved in cell wall biosynthesis
MSVAGSARAYSRTTTSALSVALVQTTVPTYRRPFLEALDERLHGCLRVLAGSDYFDPTIQLDPGSRPTIVLTNRYLFGRRLLWQRGAVGGAMGADVVIAELNPRILSTWFVLLLRRALGRPIILWGHAWPRQGAQAQSDALRQLMRRLASGVLVYTQTEARDLRRLLPGRLVEAAPNALYPLAARPTRADLDGRRATNLVFVGRLVEAKKPRLLLDAFLVARDDLPPDTQLVFVGDGPLRPELEAQAALRSHDRVVFTGTRSELEDLRAVFAGALANVIPGYAGLSLIQSLWFGVPSLIARDEPHSPEIEAAVEGVNSVFFGSDSVTSLRDALVALAGEREEWRRRRGDIARECASRYSLDGMVDAFVRVVETVAP